MKTILSISCFIVFNPFSILFTQPSDFKVELVQVIFRHGDRTAQENEVYKSDPYAKVFKENGYGQLTKIGMQREYKIGQMLRQRYNDFLGEFEADKVYGYSTGLDRTIISLQLVLAALYPPTPKTSWDSDVHWIPIPTHYHPLDNNFLAHTFVSSRYIQLLEATKKSPEIQNKFQKYNDFLEYLKMNIIGMTSLKPLGIGDIFSNVRAALSMGLPLPDWCPEEIYTKLVNLTVITQAALTHTPLLTRIMVGPMVERFLKNIDDNEKRTNKRKIYLYSGHDVNVSAFSNAHKFIGIPEIPDYGSALIIEKLRGPDNQAYIRMVLWTGTTEKLIPVKVANFDNECPLSQYKSWVTSILPDDEARSYFPTNLKNHLKNLD